MTKTIVCVEGLGKALYKRRQDSALDAEQRFLVQIPGGRRITKKASNLIVGDIIILSRENAVVVRERLA